MILSKLHGFIFIKGAKVAGTSVEIALSAICGPDDIVCPIGPFFELKRLETGGGARNYSTDRASELSYLDALTRTAVTDLPKLSMPAAIYFNHMGLRTVLQLQAPEVSAYRVLCVERYPYAKIISWANHMLNRGKYVTGGEIRSDSRELKNYLRRAVEDGNITAVKNRPLPSSGRLDLSPCHALREPGWRLSAICEQLGYRIMPKTATCEEGDSRQ